MIARGRHGPRGPAPKTPDKMTVGERVIAFIEEYCRVPEGEGVVKVGAPLRLEAFQKQFILDIYDNPVGTSRAYLSIARKNGKTALIAAIALAHIVGPVAEQNSQVISGARSRDQAGIVFKLMSKMIALEPRLQPITRIIPSTKTIFGLRKNVEYRAISAEAKTAHGLSPLVAILDEVGQVKGPQDDFVDAVETSQGAYTAPKLFAISTQAASDNDLFSIWIDDARESKDPHIICRVYEAAKGCDLLDEVEWRKANPAVGKFRSTEDLRKLATKATRMPSFAATFRNLNLNQRVETRSPLIPRDLWRENGAAPAPIDQLKKKKLWGGLDLASVSDLAALVLVSEDDDVIPTFWLPGDGIREKAKADRVAYDVWAEQGYLQLTPGRSIEYEYIAEFLRALFDQFDIQCIAFDRYLMKFLKPWLVKANFTDDEIAKFVEFGQGFVSMSPALRELESRLLQNSLKHGNQPVLEMCAGNAIAISDTAGNRKFAKSKSTGRIDGMVALAMAIGAMPMKLDTPKKPTYKLMFV